MKAVSLKIYHISKWTLLVLLICLALLSLAGRAILSNVSNFKHTIELELADYGIKGVNIDDIEADWQGLHLFLKIKGASLSIPGRSYALAVNTLSLRVRLLSSLLNRDLILESFYSSIEKLVLVRDNEGNWWLNDIPFSPSGSTQQSEPVVFEFFQRLPSFVNIDIGLIQLHDQRHQTDYFIQQSTLKSSLKDQQLSLKFISSLPQTLGNNVEVSMTGDAQLQHLFISADWLNIQRLFELASIEKIPLKQAVASFKGWVELEQFEIRTITTESTVSQLSFNKSDATSDNLSFNFLQKATRQQQRWDLQTRIENIQRGAQKFDNINAQMLLDTENNKPQIWVDQLNLSFLHELLQDVSEEKAVFKLLAEVKPVATLKNVVAELDLENPLQSIIGFEFKDFQSQKYRSIPAISGLEGSLISTRGKSQLDLHSSGVSVEFHDLFKGPILLDTVESTFFVSVKDSVISIQTENLSLKNSDASIQGRFYLQTSGQGRPFVSIRAHLENAKVEAVSRYLPVGIMHQNVVNWLDKSLISGQVNSADFLFHGRFIKPSLFTEQLSGTMLASAQVSNPQVDYLETWPAVGQGQGTVEFHNTSMLADFNGVNYAGSRVDRVTVGIANFLAASLSIDATTTTPAKDLLTTLSRLPVLNAFDEVKRKATRVEGPVEAGLKLTIPLYHGLHEKLKVTARADLKKVSLSIPDWMIDLKNVTGRVNIDDHKVTASALTANYLGDAITMDIQPDAERFRTKINIQGNIHSQNLLTLTPDFIRQPVSGVSPWDVSVSIAHQIDPQQAFLEIAATSELQGTKLDFPDPLRLSEKQQKRITFKASLLQFDDFKFDLKMADDAWASGELKFGDTITRNLQWLDISLGSQTEGIYSKGIQLTGNTALIDWNDWTEYQNLYFQQDDSNGQPFLQQVKTVDLKIDRLLMGSQVALDSRVKIDNDGKQLQGYIDSNMVKGSFQLPYRMSIQDPLVADLEYLKLSKNETAEAQDSQQMNINNMPNLLIKSKTLSVENMDFSNLLLSTRSETNKFVIDQLNFKRDDIQLKSSGHWQYEPATNNHVSVFNIDIQGKDFGKTVKNLGLGESIRGSSIKFNGQLGWSGELYRINWPSLLGEVNLELKDGYLRNVDPGAGRFVGLLSFNALPKRLFLDFGDVLREGMQFNKIKGKFTIKGETMETDNASMESVSARVKVKGNTNLRNQTYDQTMIIIPKIGDTLPILGSLAAGSTVGWGLLLLQKIFKKPIEKSVEIEYKVTGNWANPQVTLVDKPKNKQPAESFNVKD